MQQRQGFPKLATPLRIISKLNNMALTISQGWHNTKPDDVIIQKLLHTEKQKFKITQKENTKVFYIEPCHKELVLSTKSGWGDMVYSEVRVEKYDQDTNQLWRIVAYDQVVYSEKKQNKSVFEYKQLTKEVVETTETKSSSIKTNSLGLGYTTQVKPIQQTKLTQTGKVLTTIYNLGYQFASGPQVKTSTIELKSSSTTVTPTNYQQQPQQQQQPQYTIANPPRFPIKQKNNLLPIDLDNRGWFFIQNVKFNLVLEVEGGIDEPGMSVVLNRLNGNRNQLWRFQ